MRAVIQRVNYASVEINSKIYAQIGNGVLILVGIDKGDTEQDSFWLAKKIVNLRIFNDEDGKMNNSLLEINGDILVVSQFTLFASTKKGTRPSYSRSASPEIAIPLYERFVSDLQSFIMTKVKTGIFGAYMKVKLENDGPVTIIIDTKNKE